MTQATPTHSSTENRDVMAVLCFTLTAPLPMLFGGLSFQTVGMTIVLASFSAGHIMLFRREDALPAIVGVIVGTAIWMYGIL